jgi:ribonuclease P/MRP protein subunit RPP1
MYEGVHARPDGDATVSRLAITAREYGFDGIVVRNHGDTQAGYDAERIADETGVDVVKGVEIRVDEPDRASGYLGSYRSTHTIVALHGGTVALNRFAVEHPRVDVLAHPLADDGDINHVLAKAAADNGVRIEMNLRPVLSTAGGPRVQYLQKLRKLRELIEYYNVPYVVSADPHSHLQLRAPRELRALGGQIGFDPEAIETGLEEWQRLAARNRDRQSESFIEPGVRSGQYEEDP